uniref:HTH tetR-type domain-containing protein n=1 Tax=Tanacetum cinerariifolium TaxID=118510 RepID=A0A699GHI2_TANCI|nr:hypothetical protein [Tanacetum cinerariifolium]
MTFGQAGGQYAAASGVLQDEVDAIVKRAVDAGINFIDMANVYASGQSEEMVGRALKNLGIARQDIVMATKFEHPTGTGVNDSGGSRAHIINAVKASLQRIGTDHIDLYQMHGFDPATPIEETLRALDDLVQQGHVRYVGVSNWAAWNVSRALGIADRHALSRFQSYQSYYSLVGRDAEREIVPMLRAEGLGMLVYSPLAGGYLTGKYRHRNAAGRRSSVQFPPVDEQRGADLLPIVESIATAHSTSMEAVALAWLRHQPAVTSIILGVKSVAQLDANLAAVDLTLNTDELNRLGAAGAPVPEYPGWMLAHSSAARQTLLNTGKQPTPDGEQQVAILVLLASQYHLFSRLSSGSVFAAEMPRSAIIMFNWAFSAILLLALFHLLVDLGTLALLPVLGHSVAIAPGLRYTLGAAAMMLAAIGVQAAVRVPAQRDVVVEIVDLPLAFEGYTVVQLTDLHLSRLFPAAWSEAVVSKANALNPELIVVTGDLIDGSVAARARDIAPLAALRAADGVFVIPGNHEYFFDQQAWMRQFSRLGMIALENSHVVLARHGASLVLAGVTDLSASETGSPKPDLAKALAGAPTNAPVILLDHQPKNARAAAARGVALQLSGHTHGGLVAGLGPIFAWANGGFVSGHYEVQGMTFTMTDAQAGPGAVEDHAMDPTYFHAIKQAVEYRLRQLFPEQEPTDQLSNAMRSAVLGAGKRLRPMLLISVGRELGYDTPQLLELACAVEIVHAASLILDDLPCMDDATLRRGAPALHRQYGEDIAVLASVSLVSHAFTIVSGAVGVAAPIRMRLVTVLAQAIGSQGLSGGQFDDLHGSLEQSPFDIASRNALKTSALLCVAVEMAAIAAQASDTVTCSLHAFASAAGQAFQIRDDLLDAGMGQNELRGDFIGKDTGQDTGKVTFLSTVGVEETYKRMENELHQAERCLKQALGPGNRTLGLLAALDQLPDFALRVSGFFLVTMASNRWYRCDFDNAWKRTSATGFSASAADTSQGVAKALGGGYHVFLAEEYLFDEEETVPKWGFPKLFAEELTPGQARSADTVSTIIEAAARILEAEGHNGFSTNAVARRAGVSIGTLYQYFPNKEAVLGALLARETAQLLSHAELALEQPIAEDALSTLVAAAIEHQFKRPRLARILDFEEAQLPFDASTRDINEGITEVALQIIRRLGPRFQEDEHTVAQDVIAIMKGIVDAAGSSAEANPAAVEKRVRRAIFGYLSLDDKRLQWRSVADQLWPKFPKLAAMMDDAEHEVLTFMTFPKAHRTQIHSTNPLERLDAEVKRRTKFIGIFPNDGAIIRLVGAMMLEQNDEWSLQRRYIVTVKRMSSSQAYWKIRVSQSKIICTVWTSSNKDYPGYSLEPSRINC